MSSAPPTASAPPRPAVPPAAELTPPIRDFFVCIGAQKSGTTWLARILSSHPELFMSPVKELHYFDHVGSLTRHLSERKLRSRNRKFLQRLMTQWSRFHELKRQRAWEISFSIYSSVGRSWIRPYVVPSSKRCLGER